MKIALYGSSGTGKTTLAKMISEHLGIPLNPVGSRSVAKSMGFDNPYDVDKAGKRKEFQHQLQLAKLGWERATRDFVTDRTYMDEMAYTALHDRLAVDDWYMRQAWQGFRLYTHVIWCPMEAFFDLGDDPARVVDVAYHQLFQKMVRGFVLEAVADIPEAFRSRPVLLECWPCERDHRQKWVENMDWRTKTQV